MIDVESEEKNGFNFKSIVRFIILSVCSVVAFIADIILKSNTNTSLNTLTQVMLSSVLVLAGFWISCYFLLLQFYKNRYPLEIIQNEFLKTVTNNISNIAFIIIWGCVFVGYGGGYVSQLWFALVSVSIIIDILISTYKSNKALMINTYINKYAKELNEQLKNNKNILYRQKLDEIFKKMEKIFEECFVKQEYYICQNIAKNISEIFKTLISECNKMIVEKKASEDEIHYFFKKVILNSIYQIELSKECTSEYFLDSLTNQHKENIVACIQTKQFTLFEEYINEINKLSYQLQNKGYDIVVELMFNVHKKIAKKLILSNCEEIWIKYLIDECYHMTMSLNYLQKNTNIKYFIDLLTYCMEMSLKNNNNNNDNGNIYNYLFQTLNKFSILAAKINHSFENIVVYYAHYSFKLLEYGELDKVENYLKLLDIIQPDLIGDSRWLDYIFYFLSQVSDKWPNELKGKNRERNVNILLDIISSDIQPSSILLPKFKEIIESNQYNENVIRDVSNNFYSLFNRAIIKNNTGIFYLFTEELNECLTSLKARSKNIQIILFDIYLYVLSKVSNIENKLFAEITFSQLIKCIEQIDKEDNISADFGNYIINKLTSIATLRFKVNEDFTRKIVDCMFGFLKENEELKFILRDKDKLKLLYRSIFNIGMSCIENNCETGLRSVSNAMGWMILGSIKRGQSDLTKYLLERVIEIYSIAKNMNISEKTLTYMMTLFTTIGTYCCKDPQLYGYRSQILAEIKTEDIGVITTAIKLRTSETSTWNDLFDNRTEELTKQFLKKVYESRTHVRV